MAIAPQPRLQTAHRLERFTYDFNPLYRALASPSAHPRRIGKPAAKMMTPVRYILLALFLVVRIAP